MAIGITITMKDQEPVETDVEEDYTFKDVIEELASYWDVPHDQYVLKRGPDVFEGNTKFSDVGSKQNDVFEFVKGYEVNLGRPPPPPISADLPPEIQWLYYNIGLDPDGLEMVSDDEQEPIREMEFRYEPDGKTYKIRLEVASGKVREYIGPE